MIGNFFWIRSIGKVEGRSDSICLHLLMTLDSMDSDDPELFLGNSSRSVVIVDEVYF
jgi:hypothetical protein